MSTVDFPEENDEGYFASVSDLMVGILFVFLLMLTVFALNFQDAATAAAQARKQAQEQEQRAAQAQREAEAERTKNERLRDLLKKAVARMKRDTEDRLNARQRLLVNLEGRLKDQGVSVIIDPDSGVLRLPESMLFEKGQSTLGAGSGASQTKRLSPRETLTKVAEALATVLPCFVAIDAREGCEDRDRSTLEGVLIEGHSDKLGYRDVGRTLSPEESSDRNDRLSVERALNVFSELKKDKRLDDLKNASGLRLLAVSAYGDRRPVALGDTSEDYQKNRRIDLRFLLSARTSDELKHLVDEIQPALGDAP